MALTKSWASGGRTGDGLAAVTQVAFSVWISDTPAANLLLQGQIQGVLQSGQFLVGLASFVQQTPFTVLAAQTLSLPSPAMPAVPGSGNTFWNVQCDPNTGVCTIYTSSSAYPAAQACAAPNASQNQVILLQQKLPTGTLNPSLVEVDLTDMW